MLVGNNLYPVEVKITDITQHIFPQSYFKLQFLQRREKYYREDAVAFVLFNAVAFVLAKHQVPIDERRPNTQKRNDTLRVFKINSKAYNLDLKIRLGQYSRGLHGFGTRTQLGLWLRNLRLHLQHLFRVCFPKTQSFRLQKLAVYRLRFSSQV